MREVLSKNWVIFTILFLIVLCLYFFNSSIELSKKLDQANRNYESERINHAQQQILSLNQFKEYEFKIDSLAKVLGIKSKQIRNVIVTKYNVKYDTVYEKEIIYDSAYNTINFSFNEPNGCYLIEGTAKGNVSDITLNKIETNDIITTYLYDTQGYFFFSLFPKFWKDKIIVAKVYSECKGDTISVSKNILIR